MTVVAQVEEFRVGRVIRRSFGIIAMGLIAQTLYRKLKFVIPPVAAPSPT